MRLIAAGLLVLLLGAQSALAEQILRRPADFEPETLDPQKSSSLGVMAIDRDLFIGLVGLDANLRAQPGVAERWEVSADGRRWTFHLRPGVTWSNGEALTADDFVYAFRRLVDPKTASGDPGALAEVAGAADIVSGKASDPATLGVVAPDAATLEIALVTPRPDFLLLMSDPQVFPLHRATVERWGNEWTKPEHIVSNGAFTLASWVPQGEIVLRRNPGFYDAARVKLDAVHWIITSDLPAGLRRYRGGELDMVRLNRDTIGWARENDPAELVITPTNGGIILAIDLTKGTLAGDARLRQAINLGIDRQTLVTRIDSRGATAAYSVNSPTISDYAAPAMPFANEAMPARLAQARALMADAGYGPDHPCTLDVIYPTSDAGKQILIGIRQMLLPIGVDLTLDNMEWQVFTARLKQHDFTLAFVGAQAAYDDPSDALTHYWSQSGNDNLSGYRNPEFDTLYEAGLVEMDAAKRRADFEAAEKLALDDYAFVPLENNVESFLVRNTVQGFVGNSRFPQSMYLSLKGPD